jgi:hypothetical protein
MVNDLEDRLSALEAPSSHHHRHLHQHTSHALSHAAEMSSLPRLGNSAATSAVESTSARTAMPMTTNTSPPAAAAASSAFAAADRRRTAAATATTAEQLDDRVRRLVNLSAVLLREDE